MPNIIKLSSLVAVLSAAALASCSQQSSRPSDTQIEPSRAVLVAAVALGDQIEGLKVSGTARAREHAQLGFALPGRIAERPVEVGDKVQAGQLLARLESKQFRNSTKAALAGQQDAQARAAQLRRDKQRVEQLLASSSASREELEKVSSALESVEASLAASKVAVAEAKRRVGDTRILAPFPGTITQVLADKGEYSQPGVPVVVLSGDSQLEVELALPESLLQEVQVGDRVDVSLPILNAKGLHGQVRSIAHAPRAGRLFPVIVSLDAHSGLLPGVSVQVRLAPKTRHQLSLPIGAIVAPSGTHAFVYRVVDGVAHRIEVEPEGLAGDKVLFTGALGPGDQVIIAGQSNLVDGAVVQARDLADSPLHKRFNR